MSNEQLNNWRNSAIADIKQAESCRLASYQDQGGVWTIGWGHTYRVYQGQICTQAQADQWLKEDFEIAAGDLDIHAPWWKVAPDPVRRGLINMSFNLGWTRLSGFVHMLAAGADSDWNKMADEALASRWAKQVGDRDLVIAALFRAGNQMELQV